MVNIKLRRVFSYVILISNILQPSKAIKSERGVEVGTVGWVGSIKLCSYSI